MPGKRRSLRRDKFLGEMEKVVPWERLVEIIQPYYPTGQRGRPPVGLGRMLRIYFLPQWYGLADAALEDTIYDSQAMRGFTGIDLGAEAVPDATTEEAEGNREAGGRASRCSISGTCSRSMP